MESTKFSSFGVYVTNSERENLDKFKEVVEKTGLETTEYGNIKVDEKYMTSRKGVFAGGDLIGTKATVAWAARSGRNASEEIQKYLLGEE